MRRKTRKGGGRQVEVVIDHLGARGDGVAEVDGQALYLPGALPGERVLARVTGRKAGGLKGVVLELLEAAPERCDPPCPYFGPCGGCRLQHLEPIAYKEWKLALLDRAFARGGIVAEHPLELVTVPPGTRRRAEFAFIKLDTGVTLGFHELASHRILDIDSCPLLVPSLQECLPGLRRLLGRSCAEGERGEAYLMSSETGIDLLIRARSWPDLAAREALNEAAHEEDLARIGWAVPGSEPEPIVEIRPPRVTFSGFEVFPPPGAFLQPSAEGEAVLLERALGFLPPGTRTIVDLYSGSGTFALAFAASGLKVHAVEGDAAALGALWATGRRSERASGVTVEHRDLARQPLRPDELANADAVLFDPPRAGGREQASQLADSDVRTVIAVSCNPGTLSRDIRILVGGGYRLIRAVGVDQFPWTGHLEVIGVLHKTG